MSLFGGNVGLNSPENRMVTSPGSIGSHAVSQQQQQQHQNNSLMGGMNMKLHSTNSWSSGDSSSSASGGGTIQGGMLQVKPELQAQHSIESMENGNNARGPLTPGAQRSPLGHNMGIMEACSRYGISGNGISSPVATPTSPECPEGGYGGGATAMAMVHGQQHGSYGSVSRPMTSPHGSHCVANPFNFTVNNLIHRNYKI